MLQHAIDAAAAAGVDEIVVVLGHDAERIEAALRLPGRARIVVNPDFASGQASSLRAGLAATAPGTEAAVILLGDQPGVSPAAIRAVADAYGAARAPIVRSAYGGEPGHPVLLARETWEGVAAPNADVGARELVAAHPDWVLDAEVPGTAPPDIDTPDDYERIHRSRAPGAAGSHPGPA